MRGLEANAEISKLSGPSRLLASFRRGATAVEPDAQSTYHTSRPLAIKMNQWLLSTHVRRHP